MWFEVLPSFAIILTSLSLPSVVTYVTNRLFLGNPYKRSLNTTEDVHHYLRDMRISGIDDPYKQILLNSSPDAEL